MTTSRPPAARRSFTSPVVDYEPAPVGSASAPCPAPSPAALRRHTPRPLRSTRTAQSGTELDKGSGTDPPRAAAVFTDLALRRVLEVLDRRRPVSHLKTLLAPAQLDAVAALSRQPRSAQQTGAALRRMRLHSSNGHSAVEVSATYTRGTRVRAIAARVEPLGDGRWQVTALQIG
ncbi:Rv3235 family protein [Mycolicibacterium sp. F2034L]|uniref:Rv3235 family protein n=1 Tax=Mycolicibacterium sp. F2034L TaxID=2926422 RepID=UPI001FF4A121|nr:Rv3235 family protein [Mycolicibacterium sp. F2034L]MCK0174620.1 Rv3235 family protein [Mycolicibacterium sp. F2034L]